MLVIISKNDREVCNLSDVLLNDTSVLNNICKKVYFNVQDKDKNTLDEQLKILLDDIKMNIANLSNILLKSEDK